MDALHLTLPLPPADLSPNARGHWSKKARAVKAYRALAEAEARRIPASRRPSWDRAEARAAFYLPDRRRRDEDNLASSLKAAWDGLVAAGVLIDDYALRHQPIEIHLDPSNPRVELTLTPIP